jgi:hypothetical protein
MKEGYNQIVEIESLDVLASDNSKLLAAILLCFCDEISSDNELKKDYSFNIIKYGFQGYYPVIGVRYNSEQCEDIHNLIEQKFLLFLQAKSIKEFVDFAIDNNSRVKQSMDDFT